MEKRQKNNYIELCRFIFCCVIFLHHSGFVSKTGVSKILPYGSLGADFFYILTGLFAMAHIAKNTSEISEKMEYAMRYTIKKLMKIFPYAAFGSLSIYVLQFISPDTPMGIKDRILNLQNIPFEIFMTPMSGTMPVNLASYRNAPMWFLSAMAMALPVVLYLTLRNMDVFKHWIVWFVPPLIFAYLIYNTEGVITWDYYTGFLYAGVLRAFADMLLGCMVYVASGFVEEKMMPENKIVKILLTVFEVSLLLAVLYTCNRILGGYDQVVAIYAMVLLLLISYSRISYSSSLGGSNIFGFLGKISMVIYCIHWAVYKYISKFVTGYGYWETVFITFALTFALSMFLMTVFQKITKNKRN